MDKDRKLISWESVYNEKQKHWEYYLQYEGEESKKVIGELYCREYIKNNIVEDIKISIKEGYLYCCYVYNRILIEYLDGEDNKFSNWEGLSRKWIKDGKVSEGEYWIEGKQYTFEEYYRYLDKVGKLELGEIKQTIGGIEYCCEKSGAGLRFRISQIDRLIELYDNYLHYSVENLNTLIAHYKTFDNNLGKHKELIKEFARLYKIYGCEVVVKDLYKINSVKKSEVVIKKEIDSILKEIYKPMEENKEIYKPMEENKIEYNNKTEYKAEVTYYYREGGGIKELHNCLGPAVYYKYWDERNEYWVEGKKMSDREYSEAAWSEEVKKINASSQANKEERIKTIELETKEAGEEIKKKGVKYKEIHERIEDIEYTYREWEEGCEKKRELHNVHGESVYYGNMDERNEYWVEGKQMSDREYSEWSLKNNPSNLVRVKIEGGWKSIMDMSVWWYNEEKKLHREDGAAQEHSDGKGDKYCLNGKYLSKKEWEKEVLRIKEEKLGIKYKYTSIVGDGEIRWYREWEDGGEAKKELHHENLPAVQKLQDGVHDSFTEGHEYWIEGKRVDAMEFAKKATKYGVSFKIEGGWKLIGINNGNNGKKAFYYNNLKQFMGTEQQGLENLLKWNKEKGIDSIDVKYTDEKRFYKWYLKDGVEIKKLHNINGPAVYKMVNGVLDRLNNNHEYWVDGEQLTAEEFFKRYEEAEVIFKLEDGWKVVCNKVVEYYDNDKNYIGGDIYFKTIEIIETAKENNLKLKEIVENEDIKYTYDFEDDVKGLKRRWYRIWSLGGEVKKELHREGGPAVVSLSKTGEIEYGWGDELWLEGERVGLDLYVDRTIGKRKENIKTIINGQNVIVGTSGRYYLNDLWYKDRGFFYQELEKYKGGVIDEVSAAGRRIGVNSACGVVGRYLGDKFGGKVGDVMSGEFGRGMLAMVIGYGLDGKIGDEWSKELRVSGMSGIGNEVIRMFLEEMEGIEKKEIEKEGELIEDVEEKEILTEEVLEARMMT